MGQTYLIQADAVDLPLEKNVSVYHGDTWALTFQLDDTAGQAHDLTSASVTSEAEDNLEAVTALTVVMPTDLTTGTVVVKDSTSAPLAAGIYDYEVTVVEAGETTTWANGQLTVDPDI